MSYFRFALRRLLRAPTFSVTVILTLALGIGANVFVFATVNGLLLKPLGFPHADRLAWIFTRTPEEPRGKVNGDDVTALAARLPALDGIAVIGDRAFVRAVATRHERWSGLWVTPGLTDVLDVAPAAGRALDHRDIAESATPAMMISHERWEHDFGSDPAVIGGVLAFEDNKRFTVVGVLPRGLAFPLGRSPHSGNGSGFKVGVQDFWILGQDSLELPGGVVIVRIRNEHSIRDVSVQADALDGTLAPGQRREARHFVVVPLREQVLGTLGPALPLVQAFAVLVFVIACINVVSLTVVRWTNLRTESAVRHALGARPRDLAATPLAEAVYLAAAATAGGLLICVTGRALLAEMAAGSVIVERLRLDETVALMIAATCLIVAGVLAVPALLASRGSARVLGSARGERSCTRSLGQRRLLRSLVGTQVAVSVLLVLAAVALRQELGRLLSVDIGYSAERVVTADVQLYSRNSAPVFLALRDRLRSLAGVEAVGLIHSAPMTGKWVISDTMTLPDGSTSPPMSGNFVAFDYFSAMGIPILAGRDFTEQESLAANPPSIVINDVAARSLFPGSNPVGLHVFLFGGRREIVGVVKGTRDDRLDLPPTAQFYQPMFFGSSQFIVRTSGRPAPFVERLRQVLAEADPRLMVLNVEPLASVIQRTVLDRQVAARLVGASAVLALVLALVGLYGVMQYVVSNRLREFGIRTALGAQPARLIAQVVLDGAATTLVGLAAGLALAFVVGRWVTSHGVTTGTPGATAVAVTLLLILLAAVAASLGPAMHAGRISPLEGMK